MRLPRTALALVLIGGAIAAKSPTKSKRTPAPAKTPAPFDFKKQLGAVHPDRTDRTRICFDVPSLALPLGTRVTVVSLSSPQTVAEATVAGLCPASILTDTLLDGRSVSAQEIRWKGAAPEPFMWGVGILGGAKTSMKGDGVTADLDGDGIGETFADCPSTDGAHLTVWSGEARKGKRRWHGYLYLGMDLEATCTDAETGPDK